MFKNSKFIFIILALLTLSFWGNVSQALKADEEFFPLHKRTKAVRTAIRKVLDKRSIDDITSEDLKQIIVLNLSGEGVGRLKPRDLEGLTELKTLSLEGNQLSYLPSTLFNGLTNLKKLYLSENDLMVLYRETFENLISLEEVWLDHNHIRVVDGVFNGLPNLNIIKLQQNNIKRLHPEAFQDLPSLEEISISFNRLRDLPANVFAGLPALQTVNLKGNYRLNPSEFNLYFDQSQEVKVMLSEAKPSLLNSLIHGCRNIFR